MILREMPAIWEEAFRPRFYARWGRENCVIAARTRHAEYPQYRQRLSIKAAWNGTEDYFIDGRRVSVDDDTFIILNDGRVYASRVCSTTPVTSFSVFFRPGIAQEVARALRISQERQLQDPAVSCDSTIEFAEHLRRHDSAITPVLRFICRHIQAGLTDEQWCEEQLYFLAHRMIAAQDRELALEERIPAGRSSTRAELSRRIGLAVDFINSNFAQPITLAQIAAAATLSPYHCLRSFKAVHNKTPAAYLTEKRLLAAQRLLRTCDVPMDEVAAAVGFQSRATLFRRMRRLAGVTPSQIRRSAAAARCVNSSTGCESTAVASRTVRS